MRTVTLILALITLLGYHTSVAGQSRTAERIVEVPFSTLRTFDPDGSVRTVINATPGSPCTVGSTKVLAIKLSGIWKCWDFATASGSSPIDAAYITQTPNSVLNNEQALSLLGTGLVKNTTGTGVLNIAIPGTDFLTPTGNGSGLTNLNGGAITTGTVLAARLGSGSGGAVKFLREDNTWQPIPGGGDALTTSPLSQFAATTSAQLGGVITDESGSGGPLLFGNSPTITTPTIGSFANAQHNHTNAAGGGLLTDAALSTAISISKGGTGQTTATAGFNALDPLTTKGDLIVHDGTNSIRLAVGTNGTCVKANSATASGLEYGTCGSGGGAGDVTAASNFDIDNVVVRSDGTTKGVQASGVSIDDSANLSTAGTVSVGVGGSVAGIFESAEGTAPSLSANAFQIYAPTDVAAGGLAYVLPAAASTGVLLATDSSGVMTLSHVATSGSGNIARTTSPTFTTPSLGAATATSINGLTITSSTGTLTIANGKTATLSNTLTFTGTDASSVAFGTGGTVAYTIGSGTAALGTSSIGSGACASVVTVAATGVATTDTIGWGFNGDPTGVVGYQPSTNGMLTIIAYPTTNNVNFKICNNLSASVTPGAITLNWRVTR